MSSQLQNCVNFGIWSFLTYRNYDSDNDFSNNISVLKSAYNE